MNFAGRLPPSLGRGSHHVSKNDEFCIQNEKFCIKNEELCIKNDDFCSLPLTLVSVACLPKLIVDKKIDLKTDAKMDLESALFMIMFFVCRSCLIHSSSFFIHSFSFLIHSSSSLLCFTRAAPVGPPDLSLAWVYSPPDLSLASTVACSSSACLTMHPLCPQIRRWSTCQ